MLADRSNNIIVHVHVLKILRTRGRPSCLHVREKLLCRAWLEISIKNRARTIERPQTFPYIIPSARTRSWWIQIFFLAPPGNDTIIRDPDTIFSKYERLLFSNLISSQFDKNRIGFCKFEYMRYLMFRRMNDIKHVSRGSLLTLDVVEIYRMDRVKRSRFSASSRGNC